MIRKVMFLIAAILGFAAPTRTALVRSELSYNVRNARGIYPFGTYMGGTGQINLANGNFVFSRSLVNRPGRAGFSADIPLVYNSKIWDRVGSYMVIMDPGSRVGLGWRIGFPKLVQGSSSYAVILSDGSSHEIGDFGGGSWKSVDSSYMVLDPATKTVTLKGGTRLIFGNTLGNTSHMTEMKDKNGNQIKAAYLAGTANLSQVEDTLGVLASFSYNADGMLQSILSHGQSRANISFTYTPITNYASFSIPSQITQPEKLLSAVTVSVLGEDLKLCFAYDGYGELVQIDSQVIKYVYGGQPQTKTGTLASCQYATARFYDATYGSVEERLVYSHYEFVENSDREISRSDFLSYTVDQAKSNPSSVSTVEWTDEAGYSETVYAFNFSTGGRNWSDGLVQSIRRKTSPYQSPQRTLRTEETTWTQDNPSLTFIDNPRATSRKVTLDDNQFTHADFVYVADGTGNVRELSEYGFAGELLRRTTTNYLHEANPGYSSLNLIDLPASVSVADGNGTEVARTEYVYDAYPLTTYGGGILNHDPAYDTSRTMRGNVTDVRRLYQQASRYVTTSTRYDVAGSAVSSTDARGNTTTTAFSSDYFYAFPRTVTNPLGHVTTFDWWLYSDSNRVAFRNGDLKSVTDPNGVLASQLWYDYLGRKTQETTPTETKNFSYDDFEYLATSSSSSGYRYATSNPTGDVLDRQQSDPAGDNIEQSMSYNTFGRMTSESVPYREGGPVRSYSYSYDTLGRLSLKGLPGGGQFVYSYTGNSVSVTDPDGKAKNYTYNALGLVSKVTEQDDQGGMTLDTTYEYDALGRLTRIVQGSQTRTLVYDSLGRLTSGTHPESGTTGYNYDDNGNLLTEADARNVVTNHTYDSLNRLTGRTFSDGTPSATFSYDETGSSLIGSITNGKGRQTSAWTSDGIGYSWSYDASGRALLQVYRIDGTSYSLSYSYTGSGCGCPKADLQAMTYPGGMQVNYTRDTIGRIQSINSPSSPMPTYYVQSVSYNTPMGAPSIVTYGSTLDDTYTFSDTGKLSSVHLRGSTYKDVTWSYAYSWGERITQISERMKKSSNPVYYSSTFDYGYDRRARVTTATRRSDDGHDNWSTVWGMTYAYDRYGNMVTKQDSVSGTTTTFSVSSSTNRLTTLSYDAAGNVTTDGKSYAYDGMGRLARVNSGQLAAYRRDAMGRRVKKTWNYTDMWGAHTGSVLYVYGTGGEIVAEYKNETSYLGTENSTALNILMNGQIVARRVTGMLGGSSINRVEWLRRNHLGEVVVVDTKYQGSNYVSTTMQTYSQPFSSGGSDQFAGQKEDPEIGWKDFGARHYNAARVRWTSPDQILGRTYDPLSLNKYAYVRNDPVNLIDPDGRDPSPWNTDLVCFADECSLVTDLNPGWQGARSRSSPQRKRLPNYDAITERALKMAQSLLDKKDCMDFLVNNLSANFEKLADAQNHFYEMVAKLGQAGVTAGVTPAQFVQHPTETSPQWGADAMAQANINQSNQQTYGSIDLWQPFYASGVGSLVRGQAIIHELVHLVSGAGDTFLAGAVTGWKWKPSNGNEQDPANILAAGGVWQAKLMEKCK